MWVVTVRSLLCGIPLSAWYGALWLSEQITIRCGWTLLTSCSYVEILLLAAPLAPRLLYLLCRNTARMARCLLKFPTRLMMLWMAQVGSRGPPTRCVAVLNVELSPRTPPLICSRVWCILLWRSRAVPESIEIPVDGYNVLCRVTALLTIVLNLGRRAGLLPLVKATMLGGALLVITWCSAVLSRAWILLWVPNCCLLGRLVP